MLLFPVVDDYIGLVIEFFICSALVTIDCA